MPPRFVRSPISGNTEPALQRPRGLPIQGPGQTVPNNVMYSQPSPAQSVRAGVGYSSSSSPSPLGSPQPVVSNAVGQQQQFQQITSQAGQQQAGHSQQQTSVHFQQAQTSMSGQMVVRQVQQSVSQQSPQQMVQRQLQQHLLQQQPQEQDVNLLLAQRQQLQLAQQRQMIQQQRQQILQHHQLAHQRQQQQMLQQQPNPPPGSPMPPRSPVIHQQQQHQNSSIPPSSPMPPRSPMVQSLNQSQAPNSPMPPHSPMLQQMNQTQPLNSPMPPCSPVVQQQYQQQIGQNQPPSSPVLRSSMVQNLTHSVGSPMQMRHPSSSGSVSNSPVLPDRPQSVENPPTPRTPHTPHTPQSNQQGGESSQGQLEHQDDDATPGGGGGNPNNPANPLPLPAMFGRFGYFKLGLRGGSPMWSTGTGFRRGGRQGSSKSNDEKGNGSGDHQDRDAGVGTSGTKVKGQVESKSVLQSCSSARETRSIITPGKTVAVVSKVASLVCVDYNDFDDENSHTPPVTPPPSQDDEVCIPSSSSAVDNEENLSGVIESISKQDLSSTEKSDESASEKSNVLAEIGREGNGNTKELIEEKCGEEIEVSVISHEDILDSDTVVSSDLAVEEADCDNVVVFESDLAQVSSSIDTDVIEECIVTSSDIVMDISVVDALGECEKLTSCIQKDDDVLHLVDEESKVESGDIMETADVDDGLGGIELAEGSDDMPNMDMDVMHILDSRVTGVLDRDPVLDMPEGCREIHSMNERLRIGIVRSLCPLQQEKIVAITDTPESPDQEEMNVDPSPEPYLPTPDTIKDDDDDMMPMIHDDADMMELDEASRTPVTEMENVTELDIANQTAALDMNVTNSAEVPVMASVVSCQARVDTVEDSSSEALKSVVSEAATQISSSGDVVRPNLSCGLPPAAQLPPSGVHQANRTAVVTFPGLTMPATSYARGQLQNLSPLLMEEHTIVSDTMSVLNTLIASAVAPVTRQVTALVPSTVSLPRTMPFALDSELTNSTGILPVEASPATAAKEELQEAPSLLSTSYLTSPSTVVTEGTGIKVTTEVGLTASLASPECSTAAVPLHAGSRMSAACVTSDSAAHMHSSVIGVAPTLSIIKSATASSSPQRTSVLQGSAGSSSAMSAVPVCIIRSQSGGSGSEISTTVSLISSAVASTVALPVTSSQLTSATVANLVADAVNAARLPYPPSSLGQHLAFPTASVPLMTASPAGVSVIASASSVSLGGISVAADSLVPPPRMSTAPVTSSQSVSPHVPITVETNSSIMPVVDTKQSSGENQNYTVKHSSPTSIQATAEGKGVDITSKYLASQTTDSQKEDTEILDDVSSEFSQVTRPSMLENSSQNLINELPLQSLETEQSSVCTIQRPLQKIDDDDEILMKTMQLIFQDTRPSVLATVERVPHSAAAVQQETAGTEVDSSQWQCSIPDTSSTVGSVIVSEDMCSSDTQQSLIVAISSSPAANKEPIKELSLADKLLHPPVQDSLSASNKVQAISKPYPVPSSNLPTVCIEPHQSEEVRMDCEDGDKASEIPKKTNATYPHNILPASQIEPSTNLKLPLETVDSVTSSETLMDVLHAPTAIAPETSAVFSPPPQSTVATSATNIEMKSLPETVLSSKVVKSAAALSRSVLSTGLSGSGQSMLECRLTAITSGPQQNIAQTNQSVAPQGILTTSEIVSQIATVPVSMSAGSPSVVMTPRISSTPGRFSPIVTAGQAVASAVRQYVAYTQQQVASRTSPVIASISRSFSTPSPAHSPQLPAQGSVNVLAPTTARVISSKPQQSLATEQFAQSRSEALPVLSVSSSVMQTQATIASMLQPTGTILQTQVSAPPSAPGLATIQHAASYGGNSRTDGDIQTVVTSALERFGRDIILSVCSESATSSRDSGHVDSSKYPYATSAPPRIQSSCSVFSSVMHPQRRMSTGEIKPEEPARSCQFEQLTAVKTETLDSCLFQESPVPTTSIIMQQQQQSSPTVTAISKPLATSSITASRPSVATVVPKTETQHLVSSCKFSSTTQTLSQPQQQAPMLSFPHRMEESQNVLLKQLLQNTGCAQTQSQQTSSVPPHHHGAPSLPVVPSLEAQLARPVPPTPSSLLPPLLTNDSPQSQPPQMSRQLSQLTTRETSFVSRPPPQLSTSPSIPVQTDRRPDLPSREDILSPPPPTTTPRSSASGADSNIHTPSPLTSPHAVTIKKEVVPPQQSPSGDVKKEIVSDDSSMQVASEKKEFHGKIEQPSKDEIGDLGMETSCDKTTQDQAALGKCCHSLISLLVIIRNSLNCDIIK